MNPFFLFPPPPPKKKLLFSSRFTFDFIYIKNAKRSNENPFLEEEGGGGTNGGKSCNQKSLPLRTKI